MISIFKQPACRRRIILSVALLATCFPANKPAAQPAAGMIIVHAGWLLAVPGEGPKRRQSLLIEAGRIVAVKPGFLTAADLGDQSGSVRVVDLANQFVTPGLIDCHVHLTSQATAGDRLRRVEKEDSDVALAAVVAARVTLAAGFTTVRDLGATGHAIFALRDAINTGLIPGPRIVAAGAMISATAGHGDEGGYRSDVLATMQIDEGICDGADACRKMVREQIKHGADVIKFAATGGVLSVADRGVGRQFTDEEMRAIVTTAHELGRKVAAHAHDKAGMDAALHAGVDSVEHATFADAGSLELFRQTHAYAVPTQMTIGVAEHLADDSGTPAVIRNKAQLILPQMKRELRTLLSGQVRLAFGTDAGTFPHGNNAGEFRYLASAGIAPMQAIRMATVNAADLLGLSSEIGTLEPGKAADLIALATDPTLDTSTFERPVLVMRQGKIYKSVADQ